MKTLAFSNGDAVPQFGLGTWLSKPNEVYDAVIEAVKAGYRHIDCAYIYKNEKEIDNSKYNHRWTTWNYDMDTGFEQKSNR